MKFNQLSENALDFFPTVSTLSFDPDRSSAYDLKVELMPLIVKMAYTSMMREKAKYDKDNWDVEAEEYEAYKMNTAKLVEHVDEIVEELKNALSPGNLNTEKYIKLEKSNFKNPLED